MTELKRVEGESIPDPRWPTSFLLAIVVLTMCFADYWAYSIAYHQAPTIYLDIVQGTASAPAQYRVGVILLAHFLAQHGHLGLRHTLTLIDTSAAFITVFTLFYLLRRSKIYCQADPVRRWFAAAGLVVLTQFYFAWMVWYQRPETLTNAATVALMLLLLTVRPPLPKTSAWVITGLCMLGLAVIQGFVRADVAFAFHIGILLVCLTRAGEGLSLPRAVQAVVSVMAILLAGGIQYYLMKIKYPHATYGTTAPIQLIDNLTHLNIAFLLFIGPYAWTVAILLTKQREQFRGPIAALVCGSIVFFGMWLTFGRAEEVRIFMPFALSLAPLTIETAMRRFLPHNQ
ncbi:hypothetical protein [Granulicella arctica]|uniref:Uncharacterized protein n=1 Tax=Granulicella arctica TaxID=940613 RepID=A0A7Y9TKI1_9BACT|nr:hypothetical protein [Granulicella arctica]NYF79257.1 hypothetical protein [Granulicella arctica]